MQILSKVKSYSRSSNNCNSNNNPGSSFEMTAIRSHTNKADLKEIIFLSQ